MVRFLAIATAIGGLALPAHADSYWDLEAARANARAGGPVSERDAELLDRYGCLSGTRNEFCERREQRANAWRNNDRPRRKR
jgi:hypothetical protein